MEECNNKMTSWINVINSVSTNPEDFLTVDDNKICCVKVLLKNLYDFTKSFENYQVHATHALPELIIEKFDNEQIWQEIELQNSERLNRFTSDLDRILSKNVDISFPISNENYTSDSVDRLMVCDSEKLQQSKDIKEGDFIESATKIVKRDKLDKISDKRSIQKHSIVDDDFFKLSQMEEFLLSEEKRVDNGDDFEIDLFDDSYPYSDDNDNDDDEDMGEKYSDFFEPPNTGIKMNREQSELNIKRDKSINGTGSGSDKDSAPSDTESESSSNLHEKSVRFNLSGDELDSDNIDTIVDDLKKSSFDKRKDRLAQRIEELEREALSQKPWQMEGEVTANSRPENSLLEQVLEFDVTSRPAPVITEKCSQQLEDIIIQRIKDRSWDDVERKLKPVETVNEFKKRLVLDQEKSKLSLAQIYEQEYIKQRDSAVSAGVTVQENQCEELPAHKHIKTMMVSLFTKLNALTNFHYTPSLAMPDVKVVNNLPAITTEEATPAATSSSTLLAPEEVAGKKTKELISKEERSKTDKKRERRKKKRWQKIKGQNEKKGKGGTKLNAAKILLNSSKSSKNLKKSSNWQVAQVHRADSTKVIKTSSDFFNKLQNKENCRLTSLTGSQTQNRHKAKLLKL